jgi:hypothetical protein
MNKEWAQRWIKLFDGRTVELMELYAADHDKTGTENPQAGKSRVFPLPMADNEQASLLVSGRSGEPVCRWWCSEYQCYPDSLL